MAIIRAYALPHPPLAVPGVGGQHDKDAIANTLAAFDAVAAEIAAIQPEAIVYVTPHGAMYADYCHISPGKSARGDFARFHAPQVKFDVAYDTALAGKIAEIAERNGVPAGPLGERDKALDHGVMVPMWFINRRYADYKAVRVSQSGMDAAAHYRLGQSAAQAAEALGRKTVLIASGDLSHKLAADGPYGFAEDGPAFDKRVTDALAAADFLSLFQIDERLREQAAECGYNSYMVLAGAFDRVNVTAALHSYEGPLGVGYAIAGFAPVAKDDGRNILEQYERIALAEAAAKQQSEDAFRALARLSLECAVKTGKPLPPPERLPDEMKNVRAGAFVSLHKNGRLRGCIGTIAPTTANVALEIIQNAVSAGLSDSRFEPVTVDELPYLTYKVDVLSPPEDIDSAARLDVKRYGVIVTEEPENFRSGGKRGLLLPNLDGVDTVEQQINIARQKGGIAPNAPIRLQRFEVTRHE